MNLIFSLTYSSRFAPLKCSWFFMRPFPFPVHVIEFSSTFPNYT
eukprot:UN10902